MAKKVVTGMYSRGYIEIREVLGIERLKRDVYRMGVKNRLAKQLLVSCTRILVNLPFLKLSKLIICQITVGCLSYQYAPNIII